MFPIKVVAGIVVREGEILVARKKPGKSLAGFWEFPGGKMETGETPEQALKRELFEEFSIEVEVGKYIETSLYHYPNISVELMAYHATFLSGEIRLVDHDVFKWVVPEDLNSLNMAPADRPFLEKLLSGES
ncbi:(deoxy)nucleoside triphosphate pyrophosphohydrolase [Flexithrix dorotheae]|uniref:(deoxy)nucleoside triphosphate pyrophosphohydrolase n=1 Tax=Flexithrix dorotheae TaxID=70993 RepID=UPI00037A36AF|nr:(deoxy)nucleoside triphosphate pyrophosphohydrolase [Flexithrix dorotheae]